LENERKAATAKLQSMRLQMNPHFLFNALNGIQQMIMTGKEDKATLYLSKFSKLLRLVLTHSDREVVSLHEEIEMLKLYIELEALRFEDTFTYKVETDATIDINDNKVPTLLIQPFVENAIWHGLLHKEGLRNLSVKFSNDNNESLICTIEDNGIGREAAKAFAKKSSQNNHTGKGVSVAEERLKIFNQHNNDSSKLEIKDLKNGNGEATGTRVIITLPNLS
jgi:LytS/YehU family sensor histidine kinase